MPYAQPRRRKPRKLVLCFDGTGNKFHGDDSDSNILKIFRMLDRTADDQFHYYQPGIGTYVVSKELSHTSVRARLRSWYTKAKDSAIGSSFDHHVVGGYRFLMRFYCPGDDIFIFGFSRGAYIARFLAEMLDYVGLLSHGNEEMVHFAWKAFAQWQCRRGDRDAEPGGEHARKKREMYEFMKGFRETFSRPVKRIRFLGLFDTVNSVPRFETAWMERSKFPYTARSSAKAIRHAVSIDERRAKFRQDLIYQSSGKNRNNKAKTTEKADRDAPHDDRDKYRRRSSLAPTLVSQSVPKSDDDDQPIAHRGRRAASHPGTHLSLPNATDDNDDDTGPVRYRCRHRSRSRCSSVVAPAAAPDNTSDMSHVAPSDDDGFDSEEEDDDEAEQDIDEVWFAGGHGDVGGGWDVDAGTKSASHVPLAWMVREAIRAGLNFDEDKLVAMGCADVLRSQGGASSVPADMPIAQIDFAHPDYEQERRESVVPDIRINSSSPAGSSPVAESSEVDPATPTDQATHAEHHHHHHHHLSAFHEMMHRAHLARLHDSLDYACGLGRLPVLSWKLMEYLPFRRMDLQADGSWKPIRWPLPCGEVRDIPADVRVHGSVIRRMREDERYRPGNLIVGGGGRGCRHAPKEHGMGFWVCVADEGDPVGEVWTKRQDPEKGEDQI